MKKTKRAIKRKSKTPTTRARTPKKNPAAQALGRLGGLARKANLSPERASELGRLAAAARHGKPWPPPPPADVVTAASAPTDPAV